MFKRILHNMRCRLGKHAFMYSAGGRLRACPICGRREVLVFKSKYDESWKLHTYPLDADPAKDPTIVHIDGMRMELGQFYSFNKLMAEVCDSV